MVPSLFICYRLETNVHFARVTALFRINDNVYIYEDILCMCADIYSQHKASEQIRSTQIKDVKVYKQVFIVYLYKNSPKPKEAI